MGVSGGGDSVALLHLLLEAGWDRKDLFVIHLNHGMRPESLKEARFVSELCMKLRVNYFYKEYQEGGRTPAALRNFRLKAYEQAKGELGLSAIALAHTLNDQMETRILALLRGSGLKGLRGMKEWDPPFWRPLLTFLREDLRNYLLKEGIPYQNDHTNLDLTKPRAFIRHLLLPSLGRKPGQEALRIEILTDEDRFLDELALSHLKELAQGWFLPKSSLIKLPPPLLRRLLKLYLPPQTPWERIEAVRTALLREAPRPRWIQLPQGGEVLLGYRYLVLASGLPRAPVHLKKGERVRWGSLGTLVASSPSLRVLPAFRVERKEFSLPTVEERFVTPVLLTENGSWAPPFPLLEISNSPGGELTWEPTPPPWCGI